MSFFSVFRNHGEPLCIQRLPLTYDTDQSVVGLSAWCMLHGRRDRCDLLDIKEYALFFKTKIEVHIFLKHLNHDTLRTVPFIILQYFLYPDPTFYDKILGLSFILFFFDLQEIQPKPNNAFQYCVWKPVLM